MADTRIQETASKGLQEAALLPEAPSAFSMSTLHHFIRRILKELEWQMEDESKLEYLQQKRIYELKSLAGAETFNQDRPIEELEQLAPSVSPRLRSVTINHLSYGIIGGYALNAISAAFNCDTASNIFRLAAESAKTLKETKDSRSSVERETFKTQSSLAEMHVRDAKDRRDAAKQRQRELEQVARELDNDEKSVIQQLCR